MPFNSGRIAVSGPTARAKDAIAPLQTRLSRSRPGQGVVKIRVTTLNQDDETVQTFTPTLLVDRPPERR
jgi:hypothetical protein